mmetsp:Transcript_20072/g.44992  ORF Transcript_20072/g.44992 Transcript_20072/m.44992 type:complete len:504 (-) Transcript_20072:98-1609(-)
MEVTADVCAQELSEAELQRACAPLYGAVAVDAFANIIMAAVFSYFALLMHVDGNVNSPLKALMRMVGSFVVDHLKEIGKTVAVIPQMNRVPLSARLRCIANIDRAVSVVSAIMPILAITRWLNIGNVNGFRWLGYAITCPFMQLELVVLIAPVVPCFVLNAAFAFGLTFVSLGIGWVTSVMSGPLYGGSLATYLETFEIDTLRPTSKGEFVFPAICGIAIISLVQVPWLAMLYTCGRCSKRRDDLPEGFLMLLVTVVGTWWLFPTWWMLSWEGAGFLKDAKLNEMGFTFLNLLAKGSFFYQSQRMDRIFASKFPQEVAAMTQSVNVPDVLKRSYCVRRLEASPVVRTLKAYDDASLHVSALETTSSSQKSVSEQNALESEVFAQMFAMYSSGQDSPFHTGSQTAQLNHAAAAALARSTRVADEIHRHEKTDDLKAIMDAIAGLKQEMEAMKQREATTSAAVVGNTSRASASRRNSRAIVVAPGEEEQAATAATAEEKPQMLMV